ncbi:MAG: polymerase, sigma-24 subunit, subfamily [Bryobacterales bacterium]|nr:polymerase, sigma-24 subunit, subfamily [Bryobacterales bacterium]
MPVIIPGFSKATQWDVQTAVAALAATAPKDLPDDFLMTLLVTTMDDQIFNRLFEEVFDRYRTRVERWCYGVTRNRERALDLTQEVFLKAFRNIHTFRGDARLSTWLYAIARNHCLNSLKKWKTEPVDSAVQGRQTLFGASNEDTHSALEGAEAFQQVLRWVSSFLTPMEVRVITLHYAHELTLPAITRQLMLSNQSGAKAYIVSAQRKLKAFLHPARRAAA